MLGRAIALVLLACVLVSSRAAHTSAGGCPGDCDGDGVVTVAELILGVNIALGARGGDACPDFDRDGSATVTVDELVAAVNAALLGCPPEVTLLLTPSHVLLSAGGTLRVTLGVLNRGTTAAMDVYFGVLLPSGDAVLMPDGPSLVAVRGAGAGSDELSPLAALAPLVAGLTLPAGAAQSLGEVRYPFTESEPAGRYQIVLAAVRPRSLADGRVDAGDVLALETGQVTIGPALGVSVDEARAASGEVTPQEGGTVEATGADGTSYSLTVPAGAVGTPTTITLTPVSTVTGVPELGALLAAVQGSPAGLEFARPLRLAIEVPGGVPPTAILGLLVADDGTGAELLPLAAGAARIELELTHFSTVAVPRDPEELARQFGQSGFAATATNLLLQTPGLAGPDATAARALLDHLVLWYDSHIRPLLEAGKGEDFGLLSGLRELEQWDTQRAALEQCCGDVMLASGAPVHGQLSVRATDGRTRGVTGLAAAFTRANDRCLASTGSVASRLADAEAAADFSLLAFSYFLTLERGQGLYPEATQIPSPDLAAEEIDLESAAARLCVRVVIDEVLEPSLGPNQRGTLTVIAGVSLAEEPTQFTPSTALSFCANPGSPGGSHSGCSRGLTRTDAAGRASFSVTATPSGAVRYRVCGHVHHDDFNSLFFLHGSLVAQPCRTSSGGVVVTPPQTTIAPGASRQFTAVVEETSDQRVTWSVNDGGTITQDGLFTSNGALGTFFVTATSVANPDSVGAAQVEVRGSPPPPPLELCRAGGCTFEGTFDAEVFGLLGEGHVSVLVFEDSGGALFINQPLYRGCGFRIAVATDGTFTGTETFDEITCLNRRSIEGRLLTALDGFRTSGVQFRISDDESAGTFSGTRFDRQAARDDRWQAGRAKALTPGRRGRCLS